MADKKKIFCSSSEGIDWTALGVALCERLGIPPVSTSCVCGHHHMTLPTGWICGTRENGERCRCAEYQESKIYPSLTNGDGMLQLIVALHKAGCGFSLSSDEGPASAMVWGHERSTRRDGENPPEALSIAAASYLNITVPMHGEAK